LFQRALRSFVSASIILLITMVLFLLIEGAASVIVASRGGPGEPVLAERSHTEFDAELGWINRPNVRIDDLYGSGRYLETNSQRFRSRRDFALAVPHDKVRVVCTGDSFTLGYGVKNDDAWCELLSRKDERLEAINMGQGGYGVDQAYLWYRRDGQPLAHDVLIFAFTAGDFLRMMRASFTGYPKSVLTVEAGKPVIARRSSRLGYIARGLGQRLSQLRNLRFVELWHGDRRSSISDDATAMSSGDGRRLVLSMIDDLNSFHAERKTNMMLVLLPILEDYRGTGANEWQEFLRDELAKRHVPFLDLVQVMRSEPEPFVPLLFRGHYNELGNRWVADRVYDELAALPRVRERLQRIATPPRRVAELAPKVNLPSAEAISLKGARIRAYPMDGLAIQALDGSIATRWHSGGMQTGNEQIVLDLGTPTPVRSLRLRLGSAGYDYGRILAVDVAQDESRFTEVLRVGGEQATLPELDGGQEQRLNLTETATARFVRIRQLGRSDENYWSVAEIELYTAK
jgi:hypothetical protein